MKRSTVRESPSNTSKGIVYHCPYSGKQCPLHKSCHVVTTSEPLHEALSVRQKCPANGKREIEIQIGEAA